MFIIALHLLFPRIEAEALIWLVLFDLEQKGPGMHENLPKQLYLQLPFCLWKDVLLLFLSTEVLLVLFLLLSATIVTEFTQVGICASASFIETDLMVPQCMSQARQVFFLITG